MNIYTKNGDYGNTTLMNVNKVSKDDKRIHLLGSIDELNSGIGILKSLETKQELIAFFEVIQKNLMDIMAGIADNHNQSYKISREDVELLEKEIDTMEGAFPRKKEFVLPGKTFYTAQMDMVRTIVRRCERHYVGVTRSYTSDEVAGKYINRLSDYFYILARYKEYMDEDVVAKVVQAVINQVNQVK